MSLVLTIAAIAAAAMRSKQRSSTPTSPPPTAGGLGECYEGHLPGMTRHKWLAVPLGRAHLVEESDTVISLPRFADELQRYLRRNPQDAPAVRMLVDHLRDIDANLPRHLIFVVKVS